MRKIYLVFVLSVIAIISSCSSSDDFEKVPYNSVDSLSVWPLNIGNQWVFAKDTLLDTIKIDSSFISNGIQMYSARFNNILLPSFINNNQAESFIYNLDSIYTLKINAHTFTENAQMQSYSDIVLPIVSQKLDNETAFSGGNSFAHQNNSVTDSVTVNYNSVIIGKHMLEGVGGRAFQDILKIQTNYQFNFPNETKNFSLEIWLQPGIGPVKIINLENNDSQIIHSYQLF